MLYLSLKHIYVKKARMFYMFTVGSNISMQASRQLATIAHDNDADREIGEF